MAEKIEVGDLVERVFTSNSCGGDVMHVGWRGRVSAEKGKWLGFPNFADGGCESSANNFVIIEKASKEKNMSPEYKKGDVLENSYEKITIVDTSFITVKDELIDVYITQEIEDGAEGLNTYTQEELDDDGFSNREDAKEMTVEEIQKELGYKVKVVESK